MACGMTNAHFEERDAAVEPCLACDHWRSPRRLVVLAPIQPLLRPHFRHSRIAAISLSGEELIIVVAVAMLL
jgi:hypothetical protein